MGDKIGLKGKGLTNTRPSLVTQGVDSCWKHISQLEEYGLHDLKGTTVTCFPITVKVFHSSRPLSSDNGSSGETVTFTLTRMQEQEEEEKTMCVVPPLGRLLCLCTRKDPGHVITKAVFHCRHNQALNLPTKPSFCNGGVNLYGKSGLGEAEIISHGWLVVLSLALESWLRFELEVAATPVTNPGSCKV